MHHTCNDDCNADHEFYCLPHFLDGGKILVRTLMDVPYLVSALVIALIVFMRHRAVTLTKQTDAALQSELEYRKRVMGF